MCSGALRSYPIDQDAPPDSSMVATLPVSLHPATTTRDGNAITAIMCKLGTEQSDPGQRARTIVASTKEAKKVVRGLAPLQQLASFARLTSRARAGRYSGFVRVRPPQFNLMISNVPGAT